MILPILFAIGIASFPSPDAELFGRVDALITGQGFHLTTPDMDGYEHGADVSYTSSSLHEIINLEFTTGADASHKAQQIRDHTYGNSVDTPEAAPPHGSLGEHLWTYHLSRPHRRDFRIICMADGTHVDLTVTVSDKDAPELERLGWAEKFSERLARVVLADAMSLDLNDNGGAKTGATADKQGFVPLATWAATNHVELGFDDPAASVIFTWHGKSVRLYLASSKAIVNDAFVSLGGKFVLARGTTWFVPRAELETAIGP